MRSLRPLLPMLLSLLVLVGLYGTQRALFFGLNQGAFPQPPFSAFLGGVRFDLSALSWLNLPWLLLVLIVPAPAGRFAGVQRWVFVVLNAVGFFFNCVDLEYYKFTLKRSTADLFGIATGGNDLARLMPVFMRDYWYVVLIFLVSVWLTWWSYDVIMRRPREQERLLPWPQRTVWRAVLIACFAICSRGGLQLIPLAPLDAAAYASPAYLPLVLNTPFTIMTSLGKPLLEEKWYMSTATVEKVWPVIHHYRDTSVLGERPNVVVIILESFSAGYSGRLTGRTDGCMPFLDSLMGVSLSCTHAYANGRRSIDGIPAVLAGMPKLMDEAFITSAYATTPFTSLANTLGAEGYSTSFFHGGHNGTMGFDAFSKSAGFQEYMGRDQYPDPADDDGVWGIRDRPFLQFFARSLDTRKQPFLASVFSLSSHHPYELPPADAERFAGGTHRIMPTLRYADDALRGFFATARTMPWFARTLFVITADHTSDLDRDGGQSNELADYWIPLIYYAPGRVAAREVAEATQQIDILPTVLDLIGHRKPFFAFGASVLHDDRRPCAVVSNNGIYLGISPHGMLRFDGRNVIPPAADMTAVPDTRDLELPLKAAIQQFNSHLLHKQLVYTEAP